MKLGLIDIGSSTVKLSVYNIHDDKSYEVEKKESQTTKLAQGMKEANNELQIGPMAKTIIAVADFIKLTPQVEKWLLFSTSAARKAKNIQDFKDMVSNECGHELRIITDKEEAELFFKGVISDFSKDYDCVAINVGGGSTELTYGNKKGLFFSKSLPIGVVAINEEYLLSNPPMDSEYSKAVNHIKTVIAEAGVPKVKNPKETVFLHTGGELTYIKRVKCPAHKFTLSSAHPLKVDMKEFVEFADNLRKLPTVELERFVPENPMWMNGAVASNLIAIEMAKALGVDYFVPSDKNLADGIIIEFLSADGPVSR